MGLCVCVCGAVSIREQQVPGTLRGSINATTSLSQCTKKCRLLEMEGWSFSTWSFRACGESKARDCVPAMSGPLHLVVGQLSLSVVRTLDLLHDALLSRRLILHQ